MSFQNVEIISSYSREQAIEDGALIEVGYYSFKNQVTQMVVTPTLMGLVPGLNAKDKLELSRLAKVALEHLRSPMVGDYEGSKMRWFTYKDIKIQAVWNTYEGITVMHPSDY
jgi:hypothetical protein